MARGLERWFMSLHGLLLAVIGLALAIPGVRLLSLGGSGYYLVAGIATLLAGALLLRGRWLGGLVYAAMLVGTLGWALWEVGLDGWRLVPRLVAPIVLGLPLLIGGLLAAFPRRRFATCAGVAGAAVVLAFGIASLREQIESPSEGPPATVGAGDADWAYYGNAQGGSRFSPLAQINARNVAGLTLAWSTHIDQPLHGARAPTWEATPLKIGDLLYLCTTRNDIVAIDAATGAIRWRFYAHEPGSTIHAGFCRGLTYYRRPHSTGPCAARVYTATIDARLIAVDAERGAACPDFGAGGQVNLLDQIGQKIPGYYKVTSPPQLVRGKLVVGGFVADGQYVGEPSGVIRAFDAVTGKLAWAWDMGRPDRHAAPPPGETYTLGTPNSWAPMSADDALGLVYVPTGNATPDYFGAHRKPFMEKYSSSLVALDAETGAVRWSFQAVHHDLWDYDVSVQPVLIDAPARGALVPAVAQATKNGELFLLDRRDGKPIFPVVERPVPRGAVPGDRMSPTQPRSSLPDFVGQRLRETDMWGVTPLDQLWCRIRYREARYDGPFTPIGLTPSIVQPGFTGGTEWGGVSYDPGRELLVLVSNYIVNYDRLVPRRQMDAARVHPSTDPGTIDYSVVPQAGAPYGARTPPFLAPTGTPCTRPPYSRLNAVDLRTGRLAWSRPLGTARALGPYGARSLLPITIGTPSFGGAITSAGGVTFVAASLDHTFRAFETRTGRLLWRSDLPADGLATPMTYGMRDGRQFVVIVVGDKPGQVKRPGKGSDVSLTTGAGARVLAFALPKR